MRVADQPKQAKSKDLLMLAKGGLFFTHNRVTDRARTANCTAMYSGATR